jgi:hypothetical protein
VEQEFSVQDHIKTTEHHTELLDIIDENVRILFNRMDNQYEILKKLGGLLTVVNNRMEEAVRINEEAARKYEEAARKNDDVFKRLDYTIEKINERTTHLESFGVRVLDRSAGPSYAGPVERASSSLGRDYLGLWDSPEPAVQETPNVGVSASEGPAGPLPESVAAPVNVTAPEEITAPQVVAAPEVTPPDLSADQDSVAKPDVTMTSPTPLNSQDEAQATTTLVAAPPPLPTSNPPETVVVTRQLSPLPTESTSSASRLAPPPPIDEKRGGKRSRENTPPSGDRRSPRLRANSRAPSPPKIGPPKRQSESKGGGDSKRHKPNPS